MKFVLMLAFVLMSITLQAQELPLADVNQSELVKDLVKNEASDGTQYMTLWLPDVYWRYMVTSGAITELQYEEFKSATKGYSLFFIFVGDLNKKTMSWDCASESKLMNQVQLTYNGKTYSPLKDKELTVELRDFSEIMAPMMTQMFGSMGSGFRYFFFNVRDANSDCLIKEKEDADVKIYIDKEVSFVYNMPFASLFTDKHCPTDEEAYPYNYNYCPIHGAELK